MRDPGAAAARANAERDRTDEAIAQTEEAYRLYAEAFNNGVLRRNTVLAGPGVHGYVYLPWVLDRKVATPDNTWTTTTRPEDSEHEVRIQVGAYNERVLFTPGIGE